MAEPTASLVTVFGTPFITDMMEASGNNVAPVMSYNVHKLLESFKIYLHAPKQGCTY